MFKTLMFIYISVKSNVNIKLLNNELKDKIINRNCIRIREGSLFMFLDGKELKTSFLRQVLRD